VEVNPQLLKVAIPTRALLYPIHNGIAELGDRVAKFAEEEPEQEVFSASMDQVSSRIVTVLGQSLTLAKAVTLVHAHTNGKHLVHGATALNLAGVEYRHEVEFVSR